MHRASAAEPAASSDVVHAQTTFAARVLAEIRRGRLLEPEDRVVVALSGGADSVALTHVLRELASAGHVRLVGLAHLDHRLRGAASERDAEFCRDLAGRLGLPIDLAAADIQALARESGLSVEAAASRARREFLEAAADRLDASRIAVAHTRDDQAETFLLRLLRGAGARGLAGMHPSHGRIVRPLLSTTRPEVLEYLAAGEHAFVEDETNADRAVPRNRIRHELLPWLGANVNPSVADALARAATLAREDADWLDRLAGEEAERLVSHEAGRAVIDASGLRGLPPALARRVVRHAFDAVAPGRFLGFDHVACVLALTDVGERSGRGGESALDLPGARVAAADGAVVLTARHGRGVPAGRGGAASDVERIRQRPLAIPGVTTVVPRAVAIEVTRADRAPSWTRSCGPDRAVVDAEAVRLPLAVRGRRPGDEIRPLGLGRRRKLQDVLVDRKVPRDERDSLPMVVDADDRIVWAAGCLASHDFRVTERTRGVIILILKDLGGAG